MRVDHGQCFRIGMADGSDNLVDQNDSRLKRLKRSEQKFEIEACYLNLCKKVGLLRVNFLSRFYLPIFKSTKTRLK